MKFGDKLIELRKKNGYSQEELAEKLGVSRQSVSKWESNNTYPETDKIIQIANLFDCSMDDLINDKITDVESTSRKNKNNINNVWKSFLDFITNSVNMFSKMTFAEGFKCIIKMLILCLILGIGGSIICKIAASLIANIFSFLSYERVSLIREILKNVFHLIWFVIAAIIIIHTFKIRYLNNYEKVVKETEENKKEYIIDSKGEKKEVVFEKNDNDKPAEFLQTLAKVVIIFIKFIVFWILLGTIFSTIGLIIASIIVLAHIPVHTIFLWISLLLIAASIVSIQIISLLISFIFNKKVNVAANIIVFITCVVLSGLGIGMTALTARNIEYITDQSVFKTETKTIELEYKDNLVIDSYGMQAEDSNSKFKYIIDNDIENNKIIASREVDSKYFNLVKHEIEMDKLPVIRIGQFDNGKFKTFYDLFIKNLKKNKVYTFADYGSDPLVIKANEETINKLIENMKKLYLIEENRNNNEIDITIHDDKVHFKNGLEGNYNGIDDTIEYDEEDYSCKKEIETTKYGDRIIYTCNYKEEEE